MGRALGAGSELGIICVTNKIVYYRRLMAPMHFSCLNVSLQLLYKANVTVTIQMYFVRDVCRNGTIVNASQTEHI